MDYRETIFNMMSDYAINRVKEEQAKKDKATAELAATGKTKTHYEESVFIATFLWSFDAIINDLKAREDSALVEQALEDLISENKIVRWNYEGKPMNCFYLSSL